MTTEVFYPEPCPACDTGADCPDHGAPAETWPVSIMTPEDCKFWKD